MDLKILNDTAPWEWPEDADKTLMGILRDDQADEADRLLAAELAGDCVVINDELADVLLSILHDGNESEEMRGTAAISLGPALEFAYIYEFEDPDDMLISEKMFDRIKEALHKLYMDSAVPEEVRQRILAASGRAPEDWHRDAILAAYSRGDESWKQAAVFCMRFIRGFDEQILESLDSKNPDIHYEAVRAAGNWELDAAWSHVAGLVTTEGTEKSLLLAAIAAIAGIRPQEAGMILVDLAASDDEDIVEAAHEAMAMTVGLSDEDEYDRSLN